VSALAVGLLLSASAVATGQDDDRAQYPAAIENSFFSIGTGHLSYPFSQQQLAPGHTAGEIATPGVAVQAILFGRHLGKHISAQASYMRPVKYVKYRNLDGSGASRSVWMHFGTVTVQARTRVAGPLSVFGEAGLAVTSRRGFNLDEAPLVRDAQFASLLRGGGLEYRLNRSLDLVASAFYLPGHSQHNHPRTIFAAGAVRYTMRRLSDAQVAATRAAGYHFSKHLIQVGYATDAFGFGANDFFSKTVPVFWGGAVEVRRSVLSAQYQRNLFHTRKIFSFDVGASLGVWRSRQQDRFTTISAFPLMRFTLLRRKAADLYVSYAVAGPTYISKVVLDGLDTGTHFTFQDFMAVGIFAGTKRRFNVELNLNHYSNGNIFLQNAAVKVPLALKVGYAF
jgi:hypothetical protein